MREDYRQLLPNWYDGSEEHDLVLSDDIDSLASCTVLNIVKGWKIKYFYDFNTVYAPKEYKNKKKRNTKCWVDVATSKGHSFDNHLSRVTLWETWNTDMINLNQMCEVTNENYTDKYAGSTLLTVWSVYDLPLPQTEEGKMILLAIDCAYKGFYSPRFHDIQKHYLVDVLGFDDLYRVIKRHTEDDFVEIVAKYGLRGKITYDGKLSTCLPLDRIGKELGIDIQLPTEEFYVATRLEQYVCTVSSSQDFTDDISPDIKTLAFTYKDKAKYSKIKERR